MFIFLWNILIHLSQRNDQLACIGSWLVYNMSKHVIKNGHFPFKDRQSNAVDGTHGSAPVELK
jgi:hypothetical protein